MTYIIEKNIEIPPKQSRRKTCYPWEGMQVGDSFLVPGPGTAEQQGKIGNAAYSRSNQDGRKYTTRCVEGGVRVWRTA